ncbi:ImmA/IrrE family metallo-endopeptidase [Heyndrickxia coagulans]|uniref:ImmA/IrrE family metallo-endopeptidase n=1 Tax=Heyndrickxia coagulans TaxID=1398 RepID=UPI0022366414|nr:ImmA/IrrE family metallo-endopeptidase [Heyndrickxia coagulans]UZH06066.1 ImmA/IrrE family metallo-endopeptidase [Heyndrickxia coagulans]
MIKYPVRDDELCAFVCKKKGKLFAYINTYIPREKQVFAAAHELFHIWFDKNNLERPELLNTGTLENETQNVSELKANLFAAILLVPEDALDNELKLRRMRQQTISAEDIVKLMSLFFVPYKTMVRRLYEIGFINEKQLKQFYSIPDRDPQNGVLLIRKRLQLSDRSQDRTCEIFFEDLINNAIKAYDQGKISEKELRYILSLAKQSPESLNLFPEIKENACDNWDKIMEDYDGDE